MGRGAGPQRSCLQVSLSETCPFCWMSCKELATVTLAYRYYKSLQGSTLPQSHCLQSHAFHRMGLLLRTHHTIHRCAAPVVLPAFVRRNTNVRQIIPCINGELEREAAARLHPAGDKERLVSHQIPQVWQLHQEVPAPQQCAISSSTNSVNGFLAQPAG